MKHPPNTGVQLQESYADTKQRKAKQNKKANKQKTRKYN